MSKAESSPSTAAPASKSRRAVILGAGGIVAVGALSAAVRVPAAAKPFSPEFRSYLRALQAHLDACNVPEPDFGTPKNEAWDAATGEACEARHAAKRLIQNRPVRSQRDFVELALVVRDELWQQEPDGTWLQHSENNELEQAFMRGVSVVIKGGVHG
jgi:hypothetical protein